MATEDRAGEDDVVDPRVADHPLARRMIAMERLHEPLGRLRVGERSLEVLSAERRPRRVLHHDRVAGEHGRDDAVDRRQERVVPRRRIEHDAERGLGDAPLEPLFRRQRDVGERRLGDRHHVARASRHPAYFPLRLRERLPHHPCDVGGDRIGARVECGEDPLTQRDSVGEGRRAPRTRGGMGAIEDGADARVVSELDGAGDVAGERVVDGEIGHGDGSIPGDEPQAASHDRHLYVTIDAMRNSVLALSSLALAVGFGAACSSSSSNPAVTSDDGGGGGDDAGAPSITYAPTGCAYTVTAPESRGFTDQALDAPTAFTDPTMAAPLRVRIGLGGGTTFGQAGYPDATTTAAFTWETTGTDVVAAQVQIGTSPTSFSTVQTGMSWTTPPPR